MAAETASTASGPRRARELLTAAGPAVLALLASQHHALHMLILTFGVGTAGVAFMTAYPALRRVMLGVSLLVAGVAAYRATRPGRPRAMRLTHVLSVAATLLLVGWSVNEYGP